MLRSKAPLRRMRAFSCCRFPSDDSRAAHPQIEYRQEQRYGEYDHRNRRSVTDHAFGKNLLVTVKLQNVCRVRWPALGHDEHQIENFERIDGAKQQGQKQSGFEQRQSHMPKLLPSGRAVDIGGFIKVTGYSL